MIIYCENVFRLRNKTGRPVKRVKLLVESVRVKGKILVFIYFSDIFPRCSLKPTYQIKLIKEPFHPQFVARPKPCDICNPCSIQAFDLKKKPFSHPFVYTVSLTLSLYD